MEKPIVFVDLARCSDQDLQKILREVDAADLAMALKGAGPALCDKVFRTMSNLGARLLREDMEYLGKVRPEDVEDAQKRILGIARSLQNAGEITIP
jgi:flagellar motor switch protein FliG